ncbi:MAG: ABC transporter permease, partial [Coprobacillus sp.]
YVIMNILNKESYINATLYSDAIIIGSICSFAFAIIGFFIPVSYTMKNALTGTFDHKNFQYFQIRYKKLKKQTAKQLAYRSLSTNKKFTIILIIATICPIYCFAQLQKTITNTKQEKQSFLEEELPFLDKYVTIESRETDMDIDIVTQLKQYTKDVQAFPMYPIDISDINITQQSVDDGSQITGEYCLSAINQNYMKIIDSSKYIGRFPQKDDEVFLTNQMFERVNIDGERVDSIEYDLGDTIIVKDQVMKVVGFTTPSIYVKVDGICSYEYRTNYLMENAFYVTETTYQKLTQKSANEINYIKAFTDTDNYQDVSVLMSHYSQYIGAPIRDSYQVIENMKTEIVDDYQSDIDTQKMTTIIVACSAFMIYAFMNYYDIIAHKKEYAMLKILGATSSKLIIMQFFKALIITSFSSCIALVFLIQEFNISQLSSLISIIFIFVPMLVVMSLIYIIPILSLIKQDPLEILGIED